MADTVAKYRADATLAKLLKEAEKAGIALHIETDNDAYEVRVRREGSALRRVEDYDPERARQGLDESFGAFADIDADAFIAEMKANRE